MRWSGFSWLNKGLVVASVNTILNIQVVQNRGFLIQSS